MTPEELRLNIITLLEQTTTALLLNPKPPAKAQSLTEALDDALDVYEALVKATSSSNRGYELRDLTSTEKPLYERTLHVIGLLKTLHYPKAG